MNQLKAFRYLQALFVLTITVIAGAPAHGQDQPTMVLFCQPAQGVSPANFLDLSPYVEGSSARSTEFQVVNFRPGNPVVGAAIQAGTLTAQDVASPLSRESAHKVAGVFRASHIMFISVETTKDGLIMKLLGEVRTGVDTWSQVLIETYGPPRKKLRLVEDLNGCLTTIGLRLNGKQMISQAAVKPIGENGPGKTTPSKTTTPNNATPVKPKPAEPEKQTVPRVSTYDLLIEKARRNGDLAALIVALRKAVTERPRDPGMRRDLAQAYRDRGWLDVARDEVQFATALSPNDASLHRLLGELTRDSGDPAAALKELKLAVDMDPKDSRNWQALGEALAADDKPDEAIKALQTATITEPKTPGAFFRLARISLQYGRFADAAKALQAVKPLISTEDSSTVTRDYSAMLTVVESTVREALQKMQATRLAFQNGSKNREETFKSITSLRKSCEDVSVFVELLPEIGFSKIQAIYQEASGLAVQCADKLLDHLESQTSSSVEEFNLLRLESGRQLSDASKRLKAIVSPGGDK